MKNLYYILGLTGGIILASLNTSYAYVNPLKVTGYSEYGSYGADPHLIKWQGKYYMYSTGEPGQNTQNSYTSLSPRSDAHTEPALWVSSDLVNWSKKPLVIDFNSQIINDLTGWGWSPYVFYHIDGHFYMYMTVADGVNPSFTVLLKSQAFQGQTDSDVRNQVPYRFSLVQAKWVENAMDSTVYQTFTTTPTGTPGDEHYIVSSNLTLYFNRDELLPLSQYSLGKRYGIKYYNLSSPVQQPEAGISVDSTIFWDDTTEATFNSSLGRMEDCYIQDTGTNYWTEGPQAVQLFEKSTKTTKTYLYYTGYHWDSPSYDYHEELCIDGQRQTADFIGVDSTGHLKATGHSHIFLGPDLKTHYAAYHAINTYSGMHRNLMLNKVNSDLKGTNKLSNDYAVYSNPQQPNKSWNFMASNNWTQQHGGTGAWGTWDDHDGDYGLLWGDNRWQTDWSVKYASVGQNENYNAEFNLRYGWLGKGNAAYSKYGAIVSYDPVTDTGLYIFFEPTHNLIAFYVKKNGQQIRNWEAVFLPAEFNFNAWHTLRVNKTGNDFHVFIDDTYLITKNYGINITGSNIGYVIEDIHGEFGYTAYSPE